MQLATFNLYYVVSFTVAGHRADFLIAKGSWTVLSVRRLMTGIGLLGPAVFVLLFGSVSSVAVAIR